MKSTLDTNILVSGVIRKGKPHRLLDLKEFEGIKIVTASEMLKILEGK